MAVEAAAVVAAVEVAAVVAGAQTFAVEGDDDHQWLLPRERLSDVGRHTSSRSLLVFISDLQVCLSIPARNPARSSRHC